MSGPPFKINPRKTFICSGVASLNWPARLGPITGGEPNFSLRGRWQSEQRWRNKPSPRRVCSESASGPERETTGLSCAGRCDHPPRPSTAKANAEIARMTLGIFKIDPLSVCRRPVPTPRRRMNLLYCRRMPVSRNKMPSLRHLLSPRKLLLDDKPPSRAKVHQSWCEVNAGCGSLFTGNRGTFFSRMEVRRAWELNRILFAGLLFLALTASASAQSIPKWELYGGY